MSAPPMPLEGEKSEMKPGFFCYTQEVTSPEGIKMRKFSFWNSTENTQFKATFTFGEPEHLQIFSDAAKKGDDAVTISLYPGEAKEFCQAKFKSLKKGLAFGNPDKAYLEKQVAATCARTDLEMLAVRALLKANPSKDGRYTAEYIASVCIKEGIPFIDLTFPPKANPSLYRDFEEKGCPMATTVLPWKRPAEFCTDPNKTPCLFEGKIEPADIDQGAMLGNCLSCDDMELLAPDGFIDYNEVKQRYENGTLQVAGFDTSTRKIVYERPTHFIDNPGAPADGMYELTSSDDKMGGVSLRITGNHRLLLNPTVRVNSPDQQQEDHNISDSKYSKSSVNELKDWNHTDNGPIRLVAHAECGVAQTVPVGELLQSELAQLIPSLSRLRERREVDEQQQHTARELHLLFLELFGLWLGGEDSVSDDEAAVEICQGKQRNIDFIRATLPILGLVEGVDYNVSQLETDDQKTCFRISSKPWVEFFCSLYAKKNAVTAAAAASSNNTNITAAATKSLPLWAWKLECADAYRLLYGLNAAASSSGSESKNKNTAESLMIFTASKSFRDELVRFSLHAGMSSYYDVVDSKNSGYAVRIVKPIYDASPLLRKEDIKLVDNYDSGVFCVTMPSTNIVCRRRHSDPNCSYNPMMLSNCYLLCALACCAEFPDVIKNMMNVPREPELGIYRIRMCKHGWWSVVTVDDLLPLQGNTPCFTKNREEPNELWPALYEKATAKVHGSYESLRRGDASLAVADFMGVPYAKFKDLPEWKDRDNALFDFVVKCDEEDAVMTLGTPGLDPKGSGKNMSGELKELSAKYEAAGLVTGHAFSLIAAKNYKGNKLVKIRNPWGGEKEWTGTWSDGDTKNWTPDAKKALEYTDEADGTFWMDWNDVWKWFETGSVSYLKCLREQSSLRVAGNFDKGVPDVVVKITSTGNKPIKIVSGMHQKDQRGLRPGDSDGKYQGVMISVVSQDEGGKCQVVAKSGPSYMIARDIFVDAELPPKPASQPYFVIPQLYSEDDKSFVLSVFFDSTDKVDVEFVGYKEGLGKKINNAALFSPSNCSQKVAAEIQYMTPQMNGDWIEAESNQCDFSQAMKALAAKPKVPGRLNNAVDPKRVAAAAKKAEILAGKAAAAAASSKLPNGQTITVTCISASGLACMDANGFSDPYLVVAVRDKANKPRGDIEAQSTKYISKTLEPCWGESFTIDNIAPDDQFFVQCYDKDMAGDDDVMALVSIPIPSLGLKKGGAGKVVDTKFSKGKGTVKLMFAQV